MPIATKNINAEKIQGNLSIDSITASTISATTYVNLPIDVFVTGGTFSAQTLTLVNNTGGTFNVVGFSGGSSDLQYFVSGSTPSGVIYDGDRWFNTTTGIELVYIDDGDSTQWVQPFSVPGPKPDYYYQTTSISSTQSINWDKTYWGVSANTNVDITLPTAVNKDGYFLIIKDESGNCGNYRIKVTPLSGTIDGNNYIEMNINYMSLTMMARNGNWFLI